MNYYGACWKDYITDLRPKFYLVVAIYDITNVLIEMFAFFFLN